jgi:hypothetical protein
MTKAGWRHGVSCFSCVEPSACGLDGHSALSYAREVCSHDHCHSYPIRLSKSWYNTQKDVQFHSTFLTQDVEMASWSVKY